MAVIREEYVLHDEFSSVMTQCIQLCDTMNTSLNVLRGSTVNIETATASAAVSLERMADGAANTGARSTTARSKVDGLASSLKNLVATYASVKSITAFVGLADTMSQTTARLNMMNDGLQTTDELTQMIYQSAQRSRGAYQGTADMVAKLGTLAGEAFDSSAQIVAFAEQLNKQMALSGASTVGAQAAMLQLTQAMSSGVLRGEELNSILEQTPTIAQTIADYMGVNVGTMREMASEGQITAEVVKNALLGAAEVTNEAFNQLPMTWAQVWTSAQNTALMAVQPVLDGINWLANNIQTLEPLLAGLAAGALTVATALGIQAAATWIATGAAQAFFTALLTNPITWVALAVGVLAAQLYKWVQSVGGVKIAWLMLVDGFLYGWDAMKANTMAGVYAVQNFLDKMGLKFKAVDNSIRNVTGDMSVAVQNTLQDMVNGAIDIINWFISKLNAIPGISIDAVEKMTFAVTAGAKNEAEKQARANDLAAAQQEVEQRVAERAADLEAMWDQREANHAARQAQIAQKQAEATAGADTGIGGDEVPTYDQLTGIGDTLTGIKKSVDLSNEDIKSLVDVATRKYVNQVNLTTQAPVITVQGQNTGNTQRDLDALVDKIAMVMLEQLAAGSFGSTSMVF